MVKKSHVPQRGDVVWITLNLQSGHEQAARRPAVVLTPGIYNEKVELAILCPITNQIKGYPFEVIMPDGLSVSGVILADQIKSLDWRVRDAEWICTLPPRVVVAVLQKVGTLLS